MAPKDKGLKRPAHADLADTQISESAYEEQDENTKPTQEPNKESHGHRNFASKQEASQKLQDKIATFQAEIKKLGSGANQQPQLELLKNTFSNAGMPSLW